MPLALNSNFHRFGTENFSAPLKPRFFRHLAVICWFSILLFYKVNIFCSCFVPFSFLILDYRQHGKQFCNLWILFLDFLVQSLYFLIFCSYLLTEFPNHLLTEFELLIVSIRFQIFSQNWKTSKKQVIWWQCWEYHQHLINECYIERACAREFIRQIWIGDSQQGCEVTFFICCFDRKSFNLSKICYSVTRYGNLLDIAKCDIQSNCAIYRKLSTNGIYFRPTPVPLTNIAVDMLWTIVPNCQVKLRQIAKWIVLKLRNGKPSNYVTK